MRAALSFIGPLLAVALSLVGCQGTSADRPSIDAYFIVVRLHLDPSTRVGEIVDMTPEGELVGEQLRRVDCTAEQVVLIHIEDGPELPLGRASVLLATAVDATDLCEAGGRVAIQPLSYRDAELTVPIVQGPLLVGGQTLDGRLPLGELDAASFEVFPPWWRLSGRLLMESGASGRDLELEDAHASAVWRVRQLQGERLADLMGAEPSADQSMLDVLVAAGVQPDVDVDGDGRERFMDTDRDGLVDRCVDGDGTTLDGRECAGDPRFADGYDLRLIFRLVPATVL